MKQLIETLDLALEALENGKRVRNAEGGTKYQPDLEDKAITAIKQARSALVQSLEREEPVAYRSRLASGGYTYCNTPQFFDNAEPLYTTPPAAPVQELVALDVMLAEMVEAKLKELNT